MKKRPKASVTQPAAAGDAPPGPRLPFPVVGVGASAGGLEAYAQLQAKMLELEGTTNDLASLLSSTNIAVIFLDPQLHIRRFTPAVRDLLELIPQDVGRPLHNLARKFTDEDLEPDVKRMLETLEPIRREVTSFAGRTYVRSVLPHRTTLNQVEGVVITFIDITDRQRAEAALRDSVEQHRLMHESLQDFAIFLLDVDGTIKTWPKAAERVFGHTREEAIGQPLSLIFPPELVGEGPTRQELLVAKTAGSVTQEGWRMRKDGTRFWGCGVLSAVNDEQGKLRGFVKVLSDETKRRQVEDDLRQAKQRAEAANEAKDQFLATVSHELRTPLSSILLWANLIDEDGAMDPAQLREALGAIKRGAEEQRELIEDLVDTARIAAGKLSLTREPTEVNIVAESALASIETIALERGLKIEAWFDPAVGRVDVDPLRIRQVISNLLSNAVKFTDAGKISFELRRRGDEVEIKVADTGQGFAPEFQSQLFTRFQQASGEATRAHGGLGIGLSIVKQLVILHGGTITGESPGVGQGATFTVLLPLPPMPPAVFANPPASAGRAKITPVLRGSRVLVVEDAPETLRALAAVLEEAGATVVTAGTAPAALARFEQERPDLIVSDVGLPEINGYQFIAQLREAERARSLKRVPALALTAFAGEDTARKALQSGFQQCLSKPIEPLQLVTALAELKAQQEAPAG